VTTIAALQAALAAANATIYGYGVAGARLIGNDKDYAMTVMTAHLVQRDRLITLISALGATPVAALPAYRLPFAVDSAASARQLGAHLEQGNAGAAWDLIAASTPGSKVRALAIGWLGDAAKRAAHWGQQQPLPGQPS
jgi:hypothetical protein